MDKDFDVVVVGAGPAGCIAARDLARSGLSVALFDSATREYLGKTIVLEVEKAMFERVKLAMPKDDEIPYHAKRYRVFSPTGKEAFSLEREHPSLTVYLDKFVKRLLREAEGSGAKFFERHEAIGVVTSSGRVCGVMLRSGGRSQEARASLVIDATGFDAALVRALDPDLGIEFVDNRRDIVIAENYLHDINLTKAIDAIKRGVQADEEVWTRIAFQGLYSTEYHYLSTKRRIAYILVGVKEENNEPTVRELIGTFKNRKGYFGKCLYGGGGRIRIAHSLDRLVTDGFMAIGEAACQVIPAHGSGVSSALYAGHLAAQVAAEALKGGEPTTETLWPYATEYQRGRGAVLAAYDANRLAVERFTQKQFAAMLESGVICEEDMYNAALPRMMSISLGTIPKRLLGLVRNPWLIKAFIGSLMAIFAIYRHYLQYPKRYDGAAFAEWKEKTKKLFAPLCE